MDFEDGILRSGRKFRERSIRLERPTSTPVTNRILEKRKVRGDRRRSGGD